MTNDIEIKVAFIGAGRMAIEHAKAFADIAGARLAGVTSRTAERAQVFAARHDGMKVYANVESLYRDSGADLVIVAVPEMSIMSVVREALRFPWTILMEKPIGKDFAAALELEAAAAASGAKVFVGLNRRWLSSTLAARADLDASGDVRFIHVQDQQSLDTARALNHPPEVVANWMYANSIHLVDLLAAFGRGGVTSVERVVRWTPEKPGIVLAKVTFGSGDLGLYEGIWNGSGPWTCTVSTPSRRWQLAPLERAVFQNANERTLNPVDVDAWDQAFKPGFRRQAEETVNVLRGLPSALPGISEGVRSMQLTHDIFFGQ